MRKSVDKTKSMRYNNSRCWGTNNNGMWLSLVERLVWDQDAAGSNPVIPTKENRWLFSGFFICIITGFEPVKVAALNKQSGGLFIAGESRAYQARPVSMRSEAEADGESCHPDQEKFQSKDWNFFIFDIFI